MSEFLKFIQEFRFFPDYTRSGKVWLNIGPGVIGLRLVNGIGIAFDISAKSELLIVHYVPPLL